MALGSFVLVLHGHLPYVLRHGDWPHGEQWLFEAAAETYLPLLETVEACHEAGGRCPITLGLTPVLLEQLAHPRFKARFAEWLTERRRRAQDDQAHFEASNRPHLARLALRWADRYGKLLDRFEAIDRDLPAAFARHWQAGRIELLSSNATHGYMPLLLHDASAFGQFRAGLATSERILGRRPRGVWLPECAWRPGGAWRPAVLHGEPRIRRGVDQVLAGVGIHYTFVDAALFASARSEGIRTPAGYERVGWDQAAWDAGRGWRSPLEPHVATTDGADTDLTVFARHPGVSEQVWSGQVGYPGDARYLEFHKKHGENGLRYWRITGRSVGLGEKQPYEPDQVPGAIHEHASHFCHTVRSALRDHRERTGRHGVVVAAYDAELFGHWWFEGPRFIRDVMLTLNADPEVDLHTAGSFLDAHPADKVAWLPEGSWGEGGDHRVWLNDRNRWMWEVEYRAEDRFLRLLHEHVFPVERPDPRLRGLLEKAARELLLLQASDWMFMIHTGGAVDYGHIRFCLHAARFDRLCDRVEGSAPDEALAELELAEADAHDDVFTDLDLEWWRV